MARLLAGICPGTRVRLTTISGRIESAPRCDVIGASVTHSFGINCSLRVIMPSASYWGFFNQLCVIIWLLLKIFSMEPFVSADDWFSIKFLFYDMCIAMIFHSLKKSWCHFQNLYEISGSSPSCSRIPVAVASRLRNVERRRRRGARSACRAPSGKKLRACQEFRSSNTGGAVSHFI